MTTEPVTLAERLDAKRREFGRALASALCDRKSQRKYRRLRRELAELEAEARGAQWFATETA